MRLGCKILIPVLSTSALMFSGGCSEPVPRTQPSMHMVPPEAKLVGGGSDMDFTAPEPGVAFLYDWGERRAVLSRSLRKGESLKIRRRRVVDEVNNVIGEATGSDLGLYFVPERDLKLGEPPAHVEKAEIAAPKQ